MNKEFIPYEQALELKELGFDELCFGYYNKETNWGLCWSSNSIQPYNHNEIEKYGNISAPLYSQAFRWFRKKHGLLGSINVMDNCAIFYYEYEIVNHRDIEFYHDGHQARRLLNTLKFDTYEEAELACLKKLIEIVKNK